MNRRLCQYTTMHVQRWKFNKSSKRQFSYVSTENAQKLISKTTKQDNNLFFLKNLAAQIEAKRYMSDDEDSKSTNREVKVMEQSVKEPAMKDQKELKSREDGSELNAKTSSIDVGAGDGKKSVDAKSPSMKSTENDLEAGKKNLVPEKSEKDTDKKGGFWKWLTTKKQVVKKPLTQRERIERYDDPFKRFEEDIERKTRISEERENKK